MELKKWARSSRLIKALYVQGVQSREFYRSRVVQNGMGMIESLFNQQVKRAKSWWVPLSCPDRLPLDIRGDKTWPWIGGGWQMPLRGNPMAC